MGGSHIENTTAFITDGWVPHAEREREGVRMADGCVSN
jgi:hypothetical protein